MSERRIGQVEHDFSREPAIVGKLIVTQDALRHAHMVLSMGNPKVVALQKEADDRANPLIADVLDFAHTAFVFDDMGQKHPRRRSLAPAPIRYTNTASRDYVLDDNGLGVQYTVTNRRTTLRGRVIAELVTISKQDDNDFRLSLSIIRNGRNLERSLGVRNGKGWQHLVQGSERHKWQGKQQHNPGQENEELDDVLVSFRWFMDRFHNPLQTREIRDQEE